MKALSQAGLLEPKQTWLYNGREEISMRGYKPWLQIGIKYEIFLNNKYPFDVFKNQNFWAIWYLLDFLHNPLWLVVHIYLKYSLIDFVH